MKTVGMAKLNLLLGLLWAVGFATSLGSTVISSTVSNNIVATTGTKTTQNSAVSTPTAVIPSVQDVTTKPVSSPSSSQKVSALSPLPTPTTKAESVATGSASIPTTKPVTATTKVTITSKSTVSEATTPSPTQPSGVVTDKPTTAKTTQSSLLTTKVTTKEATVQMATGTKPLATTTTHGTSASPQLEVTTRSPHMHTSAISSTTASPQSTSSPTVLVGFKTTETPSKTTSETQKVSTSTITEGKSTVTTITTQFPITRESTVTPEQSIQVECQNIAFNNSHIKINVTKIAQHCVNPTASKAVDVMEIVCKAIKPEFQPPTDKCKVVLGYNNEKNNEVAILEAVVETHLNTNDLHSKLKSIKNEDGTPMFVYNSVEHNTYYEDWLSMPLIITIVCLAVSLLIIAGVYGCWHQRQSHKREQRLTEELQTMENGYHDNPTLEVMETSPEMQEKKGGLNGELGDSWIVPLDNLTREDLEEEEDTHL
ncbi:podocalyxin [Spea bombifrons]|uniref:podocalyxin n=1 Tax=Spea bombifrons TaxID=233779 RepID=UPI00234AF26E|nr:podocalyxin [Spea bombifrons]